MTNGVENVIDFIYRQREIVSEVAASSEDERPPESRLDCNNFRRVSIRFTDTVNFSEGTF